MLEREILFQISENCDLEKYKPASELLLKISRITTHELYELRKNMENDIEYLSKLKDIVETEIQYTNSLAGFSDERETLKKWHNIFFNAENDG